MHSQFLLCLLLLTSITTHAMETMSNDIIVYTISPRLNRLEKNVLRLTNTKLAQCIMPQSILNEHYRIAYATDNKSLMAEWRKKGALHAYEEIYNLFTKNERLAKKLWSHNRTLGSIESAFAHSITCNNEQFIIWLLDVEKPAYNSILVENAFAHAKQLKHDEIANQLTLYITKTKQPSFIPYAYINDYYPLPYSSLFP